jgi:hypothetical protein
MTTTRSNMFNFAGTAYLIYGTDEGFPDDIKLVTLDPSDGFKIYGGAEGDLAGTSVAAAGDFNGDGFDDILVGAVGAAPNGTGSGAAYLVIGRGTSLPEVIDLAVIGG